jgi:hypothetical protein
MTGQTTNLSKGPGAVQVHNDQTTSTSNERTALDGAP